MHAPDGYISPRDPSKLVHIGWLERRHEFPRGEVSREFFGKLVELARDPFVLFAAAGFHDCDLHQFSRGPHTLSYQNTTVEGLFNANLLIPDGSRIFYAPVAVVHYIDAFYYRPPDDFIAAVMQCPPLQSQEFLRLFIASGWKDPEPPARTS